MGLQYSTFNNGWIIQTKRSIGNSRFEHHIDQMDLKDKHRTFHPIVAKYTFKST